MLTCEVGRRGRGRGEGGPEEGSRGEERSGEEHRGRGGGGGGEGWLLRVVAICGALWKTHTQRYAAGSCVAMYYSQYS